MKEKAIQSAIMLALGGKRHVRVFRNNVGECQAVDGRYIKYGLVTGSGDLIGWRTVTITPDMVGKPIAQFLSVEVKRPKKGVVSPEQRLWLAAVNAAGGLAVVARNPEDVQRV